MSALWLGIKGATSTDTAWLFAVGLPPVLAGTWLGLKSTASWTKPPFARSCWCCC